jgi:phosphoribosylformimino-5-aminoimidazole carboxamide ribotide isomerase
MRLIPVLDLMDGVVVRGVGGQRAEYRPLVSPLAASPAPLDVARGFAAHFGLTELYLADLDAIAGAEPALGVYTALRVAGFRLWVDAGIREAGRAEVLAGAGVEGIVAGLETLAGPGLLAELAGRFGERVIFSLDLRAGVPLGNTGWGLDAWSIARQAVAAGVRRVLVLDLARVGEGGGTGTEELCARLASVHPEVELIAGGGVRGIADVRRLGEAGVAAVLVASALHEGRLTRGEIAGA